MQTVRGRRCAESVGCVEEDKEVGQDAGETETAATTGQTRGEDEQTTERRQQAVNRQDKVDE